MPAARSLLIVVAYLIAYVGLDWVSYIHPLGPFAITPWNPPPGLSVALLLTQGFAFAPALFVAGLAAELVVRGLPAGLAAAIASSAVLATGYTAMVWLLRGPLRIDPGLRALRDIARFVAVVAIGTLFVAAGYVAVYVATGRIAASEFFASAFQFWVGDALGILVTTPVLVLLLERRDDRRPFAWTWEVALQALAVAAALWAVFGIDPAHASKFFYVLFLPLIWASVRHGIEGAAAALLAMQLGIIAAVQIEGYASATVLEFQLFMTALAITGLFLGGVVSERRLARDALEAREAELQRSLRLAAAAETASALAHELNQPLSAITTYVRACALLLERPEENRERLADTMRTVTAEVGRAGEVVRRLRDFFRTGTSRLERVAVAELVKSGAARLAPRLERHRIEFREECAPGLPDLLVDRLQIETVLHNLLANAIDAIIAADPPERSVRLRAARTAAGAVKFTISDSGPGLSGEVMEGLFRPFATTKAQGMGLGLAISRSIVETHGGRLGVEPAERGAVFSFTLPPHE